MSVDKLFLTIGFVLALVIPVSAFDHQHQLWTDELQIYVHWLDGSVSQVDYAHWQQNRDGLSRYLEQLSAVSQTEYDSWQQGQKKAFLINAYNAFTIDLVLQYYPNIDSIKQIGGWFSSPWRMNFFRLMGRSMSLDEIEHGYLRQQGVFDDPRIHFAIVCASVSCPPLSDQAYQSQIIDRQLEVATKRFLADEQRNYYDVQHNCFFVSSIFKWFEDDFVDGKKGENLLSFFYQYQQSFGEGWQRLGIANGVAPSIEYLPYDWGLNDLQ